MTSAAETAILSSPYSAKPIWELLPSSPTYTKTDLLIVAGFLKWSKERLAPHSLAKDGIIFMDLIGPARSDFSRISSLFEAHGATKGYEQQWKGFYDTFIKRMLGFEEFKDLLRSDFLAVYHHLKSVPSVEGLDIKTCAIVWKGFYQGWENLDGWQKLVVFYQAYFPLKRPLTPPT